MQLLMIRPTHQSDKYTLTEGNVTSLSLIRLQPPKSSNSFQSSSSSSRSGSFPFFQSLNFLSDFTFSNCSEEGKSLHRLHSKKASPLRRHMSSTVLFSHSLNTAWQCAMTEFFTPLLYPDRTGLWVGYWRNFKSSSNRVMAVNQKLLLVGVVYDHSDKCDGAPWSCYFLFYLYWEIVRSRSVVLWRLKHEGKWIVRIRARRRVESVQGASR